MRVVIDTNCLLVAVPTRSPHKWLYEAFVEKQFEWAISNEIFREYEEKLTGFYGSRTALFVLKSFENAENVVFAEADFRWQLIKNDPDDDKFVDLAVSVGADALVSEDGDFNVLTSIPSPKVIRWRLAAFRRALKR